MPAPIASTNTCPWYGRPWRRLHGRLLMMPTTPIDGSAAMTLDRAGEDRRVDDCRSEPGRADGRRRRGLGHDQHLRAPPRVPDEAQVSVGVEYHPDFGTVARQGGDHAQRIARRQGRRRGGLLHRQRRDDQPPAGDHRRRRGDHGRARGDPLACFRRQLDPARVTGQRAHRRAYPDVKARRKRVGR